MRILRHIKKTVCMALVSMLTVSCGIIDMELNEDVQNVFDMKLNYDEVHVFVGDTFFVRPVFVPDSVSNKEVLLQVASEGIVVNQNDTLVAVGAGETQIVVTSVENSLVASCDVTVWEAWTLDPNVYSDDMVVYASVMVDGKPFNPATHRVAAVVGAECRGEGEVFELGGKQFVLFRVYSYQEWGTDEPTRPELVRFACYDKKNFTLVHSSTSLQFDGETHGSPSRPFELSF